LLSIFQVAFLQQSHRIQPLKGATPKNRARFADNYCLLAHDHFGLENDIVTIPIQAAV